MKVQGLPYRLLVSLHGIARSFDYCFMNLRIESGAAASSSKAAPLWGSAAVNVAIQPQAFSIFEKPLGRNNTQISCICANNTDRGTMVQCEVGSSTYALSHVIAGY